MSGNAQEQVPGGRLHLRDGGHSPSSKPESYKGIAIHVIRIGDRLIAAFDGNGTVRYLDSEAQHDVVDLGVAFDATANDYITAFRSIPDGT